LTDSTALNCQRLKVAFAGTPEFAAVALDSLVASDHEVVGVLTQPDRPAGRGRKLTPSVVKIRALEAGIPVQQPLSLKDPQAVQAFAEWRADVLVVAAYGLILPQAVLDLPALGCLNIHGSLLPRWRGAAPIHRAVLAGDAQTGVCIMQMDAGLDTGDVLLSESLHIGSNDTVAELHDRLAALGAQALIKALPARCNGTLTPVAQPEAGVTYAEKLSKAEAKLNFNETSELLHRKVRAFNPWPVAEAQLCEQRVRIWSSRLVESSELTEADSNAKAGTVLTTTANAVRVRTGDGALDLLSLQWPGKKAQPASEFSQGRSLPGQCLV